MTGHVANRKLVVKLCGLPSAGGAAAGLMSSYVTHAFDEAFSRQFKLTWSGRV